MKSRKKEAKPRKIIRIKQQATSAADRAWQVAVTERFGYCEHCYRTDGLCGHHHIHRRYQKTRHDIKNGICLCVECHQWAHANPKKERNFYTITAVNRGDFTSIEAVWQYERTAKYPKDKKECL